MNSSEVVAILQGHGITSVVLAVAIPVVLWIVILRPWKPKTRLMYSLRFSLWPMIFWSNHLGPAISRELFDIHGAHVPSLASTLKGFIVVSLFSAPVFFGIGWWRGKKLSPIQRKGEESRKGLEKQMKIISIVLNILLVGLVLIEFIEHGLPESSEDDFWLFILLVVTPLVTLYYLLFSSNRESWLQLYFRRKAAEEKQKLKQFEDRENP